MAQQGKFFIKESNRAINDRFMQARQRIHLLFFYLTLSFALALFYRIEIFSLISGIYISEIPYTLGSFFLYSLPADLPVILFFSLLLIPIVLFFRDKVQIQFAAVFLLLSLQTILYLFSLGYYQIFENFFSFSMLGTGLGSFWKELLSSALVELPEKIIWQFTIIHVILLGSLCIIFYFSRKLKDNRLPNWFHGKKKPFLIIMALMLLVIAYYFIDLRFNDSSSSGLLRLHANNNSKNRNSENPDKKSVWKESLTNPVFYLLFAHLHKSVKPQITDSDNIKNHLSKDNQGMRLNTESLFSKVLFPRLNVLHGKKYNVIFYFFESTAESYIGLKYRGKSVTPTWERLKKNAFVAPNHYAHYPLSVNAMVSVWSSIYELPSKRWITQVYPKLKVSSVSEVLAKNGYRSLVIHTANLKNFYHSDYLKHRKIEKLIDFKDLKKSAFKNLTDWCADDRAMVTPAIDFIKKEPAKPFFVAFFPIMPHHPYLVPEKKYQLTQEELSDSLTPSRRKRWLRYLNALYYSDQTLDYLIKKLEKENLMDNTLLFLFADHGEAFFQHPRNTLHALYLYEENVHVPFLIYNQHFFKKPVTYQGISRHVDIVPTLLDILGIPQVPEYQGVPLLSAHGKQLALLHTHWADDYLGVRDDRWKYIIRMKDQREELYDLSLDKEEKNNLIKEYPGKRYQFQQYVLKAREFKKQFFNKINVLPIKGKKSPTN